MTAWRWCCYVSGCNQTLENVSLSKTCKSNIFHVNRSYMPPFKSASRTAGRDLVDLLLSNIPET
jgi:hypothetical protein